MERAAWSGPATQRKAAHSWPLRSMGIVTMFVALLLAATLAIATAQPREAWRVVETSGRAEVVGSGPQPIALSGGSEVSGDVRIRTGSDGRVVLRRGGDTMIIAPDSVMALPAAEPGGLTRVLQFLGAMIIRVETRAADAFEVRTPYLVAVVKGTIFSVAVDASGATVHVVAGRVGVQALAGGGIVELGTGQSVRVAAGAMTAPGPSSIGAPPPVPPAERVLREVTAGSGGLLAIGSGGTVESVPMSGGGDAETILSILDPPTSAVLHGLGGNRARGSAPASPVASSPTASGAGAGATGSGGSGGGSPGGGSSGGGTSGGGQGPVRAGTP